MDYFAPFRPTTALLVVLPSSLIIYLAWVAVYRVYISPLANFPGPKLAALTGWYEFYYDCVLPGQFVFHIQDLHKQYGPIIRINPHELHVEDSEFWEELYSRSARLDKYEPMSVKFGAPNMLFTTSNSDLHAKRRAPLSPMFSKRSISHFEPVIREKVRFLCDGIAKHEDRGSVVNIRDAFTALTGDVITEYCFGLSYDQVRSANFENFHAPFMASALYSHLYLHFPWLPTVMKSLPGWIVKIMAPDLGALIVLQRDFKNKIAKIISGEDKTHLTTSFPTIFHELLESDLSAADKTAERLQDEAQLVIGAGVTTTAWALSIMFFHIMSNPVILAKLREELNSAFPDPTAEFVSIELEQLPYLSACIREGIRLSDGVTSRNPRVSPNKCIKYKDWTIPVGTPISMTGIDVQHDLEIFPRSHEYIPERWLNNPKTNKGHSLSRYLVAFGKGPRACLGENLAYAELYLTLASIIRRFNFELFETDLSDVELAYDYFLPQPKRGSKGVRAKVVRASV